MAEDFKIDFIGFAAPKSATTWIYECLREHPEICMSRPKGTHYFEKENPQQNYSSFFKHCRGEKVKGEFTPGYCLNEGAASRIENYNPQVKLIACLRDPVERVRSQYFHSLALKYPDWSKEEALHSSELLEPGFYYRHLKPFFEKFPRNNILVVLHKDLKEDATAFIQEIYSFLEVDEEFIPDSIDRRVSPTQFKLTKLGKFIHRVIGQPLSRTLIGRRLKNLPVIKRVFYSFANSYPSDFEKPEFTEKERAHLRKVYQEDIEQLEQLIGKNLSCWKHENTSQ